LHNHRSTVERLLVGVARRGVSPQPLLAAAGISANDVDDNAVVSTQQLILLLQGVMAALGDECFGLIERPVKPGTCTLVTEMALHCTDLERAIIQSVRLYDCITDELRLGWHVEGDTGALTVELRRPELDAHGLLVDFWLLYWHRTLSWMTGLLLPVQRVERRTGEAPHPGRLSYYIQQDWQAHSRRDALVFDKRYFGLPIICTAGDLARQIERARAGKPLWPESDQGHSGQLRRLLLAGGRGDALLTSIDALADALHMTPRTLRRRLEEEGTTFRALRDGCRMSIAIDRLHLEGAKVEDVAVQLGYADARSFSRAFRQWTGMAPSAYQAATLARQPKSKATSR